MYYYSPLSLIILIESTNTYNHPLNILLECMIHVLQNFKLFYREHEVCKCILLKFIGMLHLKLFKLIIEYTIHALINFKIILAERYVL